MLSSLVNCTTSSYLEAWQANGPSGWLKSRTLVAIGACFVIVFDEYRLTVNGLIFGLLAILLTGAAKGFYTAYVQTVESPVEEAETRIFFTRLVVGFSMLTAGFCFAFSESTQGMTIPSKQVPIYCLNLITSALATVLGSSVLFRVTETSDSNLRGFSLVGVVAYLSRQTPIPQYASILQVGAFAVATISASDNVFKGDLELAQIPYITLHQLPKQSDSFVTAPIGEGAHSPGSMYDPDPNGQPEDRPLFEAHKNRFPAWAKVNKILLLFLAICAWVWFLLDNFVSTRLAAESVARVRLDLDYKPASQLDIVVSMFEEPTSSVKAMMDELTQIPSIAEREPRLLIYTKDPSADVEALKNETGASMVVKLDNKGREGDTYLRHIITQWDSLAAQTFFLQGEIHNPRGFFPRVGDYYGPDTGMLSLGFSGYYCDCNECGDRFGWYDDTGVISNVYQEVFHESCNDQRVLLSYKGQFVASAGRLRANNRTLYEDLQKALVDPDSWAHHNQYLQGRPDSLNAPYFGYTLERLWSVLLQCSEARIAAYCPTLLSGQRRWGSRADCQCFDTEPY